MNKDIMKNDKVFGMPLKTFNPDKLLEEMLKADSGTIFVLGENIKKHHEGRDTVELVMCQIQKSEDSEPLQSVSSQMGGESEPSSETKGNELPTTDIDEVREAVGVLTQGNQSGGTTKQSGTFVPTPNSGLMPVEKHKRYSAFIEWLDAMGWLRELTDGQENAIFEWFERTFEPYLKGGE